MLARYIVTVSTQGSGPKAQAVFTRGSLGQPEPRALPAFARATAEADAIST
jgi:hypothetical protein